MPEWVVDERKWLPINQGSVLIDRSAILGICDEKD
jgi:hypothetical protein